MVFAALVIAASAASSDPSSVSKPSWRDRVLLAVNEEAQGRAPATEADAGKIDHAPLDRAPRGESVVLKAAVEDPSRLFAPLVFARKTGTVRYEAYTMRDKGRRGFVALLPASILSEGSFEYFIEAQHDQGGATRVGTPRKPFSAVAYDPPPVPASVTITTREPGASVRIDDNAAGKTPVTVLLLPGPHAVSVSTADGRGTEQQIELKAYQRRLTVAVELPRDASGPATLSVQSEPSNANLLLDGALIGRTPFAGTIAPGQHVVAVELDGRMREERKVLTREGRDSNLHFSLQPLPKGAAVAIESEPLGAQVVLDDKEAGRTPFLAPLGPGKHSLVLRLEGHREIGTEFVMPKDRDLSIRLDLPVGSGAGSRLTLTSQPAGALVTLDGKEAGLTPWSAEIKPGSHKVAIAAKGFVREERVLQIHPNRDADISIALNRQPGPGRLHVETEPAEALVSVDGKQVGTAPLSLDLAPGEHELDVGAEGYKTIAQQLSLDPGQQLSLRLALHEAQPEPVPPLLAAASDPQGAQFYVDGRLIGNTPIKVRSTPGRHEIRLALEGYITRSSPITLPDTRDFELRMAISLKPIRGIEEKHAPAARELAMAQVAAAHACSMQGDYVCALQSYQKAFGYDSTRTALLFNIGQMQRRLGHHQEAAVAYRAFLKNVPLEALQAKHESEKQLAWCEAMLRQGESGTAVAQAAPPPEQEDHEAPVVTHDPVKKALRGHPIRLLARIVDQRSGVGTVQACWRNLYKKEFACQPMAPERDDGYSVEVPAQAVNDGLAYYLEAYDNDDNGPARSGAPEKPNAVVVEDPAPRPISPSLVENATQKAAPTATPVSYTMVPPTALPVTAVREQLPPRKTHLASYIAGGGAVLAVMAGTLLTLHANSASDDLSRSPRPPDQANTIRARIDNDRAIGKVLFGVAGGLAIASVPLWSF